VCLMSALDGVFAFVGWFFSVQVVSSLAGLLCVRHGVATCCCCGVFACCVCSAGLGSRVTSGVAMWFVAPWPAVLGVTLCSVA
jgi:hypothetical protein